jgi:hypothetical protein
MMTMLQLLYEEAPAIDIDRRLPSWPELTVAVSATWRHGARQLDWIAVWQCGSMAIFRGGDRSRRIQSLRLQ